MSTIYLWVCLHLSIDNAARRHIHLAYLVSLVVRGDMTWAGSRATALRVVLPGHLCGCMVPTQTPPLRRVRTGDL